jgi:hypothetical protein
MNWTKLGAFNDTMACSAHATEDNIWPHFA